MISFQQQPDGALIKHFIPTMGWFNHAPLQPGSRRLLFSTLSSVCFRHCRVAWFVGSLTSWQIARPPVLNRFVSDPPVSFQKCVVLLQHPELSRNSRGCQARWQDEASVHLSSRAQCSFPERECSRDHHFPAAQTAVSSADRPQILTPKQLEKSDADAQQPAANHVRHPRSRARNLRPLQKDVRRCAGGRQVDSVFGDPEHRQADGRHRSMPRQSRDQRSIHRRFSQRYRQLEQRDRVKHAARSKAGPRLPRTRGYQMFWQTISAEHESVTIQQYI